MNAELMHDAISLADDDMVEAVDALRRRKASGRKNLLRWGALAACLCAALAGGLMGGLFGDAATESPAGSAGAGQAMPADGCGTAASSATMGQAETISVRIDRWQADGFAGTVVTGAVLDAEEGIAFEENDAVTVRLEDNAGIAGQDGSLFRYDAEAPDAEASGLPAGSIVRVEFRFYEYAPGNGADNRVYAHYIEQEGYSNES